MQEIHVVYALVENSTTSWNCRVNPSKVVELGWSNEQAHSIVLPAHEIFSVHQFGILPVVVPRFNQ